MRLRLNCVFLSACAFSVANAAPVACPITGTYASLMGLNSGGGCVIGNLAFSDFTFTSSATGGATPVSASDVVISSIINSAPSAIGFAFDDIPMIARLQQTSGITLGYSVASLPGAPLLTSASIAETGQASPDTGVASIHETVNSASLDTFLTSTLVSQPSDSVSFSGVASASVLEQLHAAGGIVGTGQITGFTNTFDETGTAAPEPRSLILVVFGCAAAAIIGKRRQNRRDSTA